MKKWKNIHEDITQEEAEEFFGEALYEELEINLTTDTVYLEDDGNWTLSAGGGKFFRIASGQLYNWNKRELIFDNWMGDFWIEKGYKLFEFQEEKNTDEMEKIKLENKQLKRRVKELENKIKAIKEII